MSVTASETEQHFLRFLIEVGLENAMVYRACFVVLTIVPQQPHLHIPDYKSTTFVCGQ